MLLKITLNGFVLGSIDNKNIAIEKKERCIHYSSEKDISFSELIDNLGISPDKISLVVVNKDKKYIRKDFNNIKLHDGDHIELFPFFIGG